MKVDIVAYIRDNERIVLGQVDVYSENWSVHPDLKFDLDWAILGNEMEFVLHRKLDMPVTHKTIRLDRGETL